MNNPRHPSTILAAMLFVIDDGITHDPDNWRFQRLRDLANEYERAQLAEQLKKSITFHPRAIQVVWPAKGESE